MDLQLLAPVALASGGGMLPLVADLGLCLVAAGVLAIAFLRSWHSFASSPGTLGSSRAARACPSPACCAPPERITCSARRRKVALGILPAIYAALDAALPSYLEALAEEHGALEAREEVID